MLGALHGPLCQAQGRLIFLIVCVDFSLHPRLKFSYGLTIGSIWNLIKHSKAHETLQGNKI